MINTLILYSIASLPVTIIPGPTMLLALSNGTTENKKIVSMGILGAACSDFILIGAVALGLGAIMLASQLLFIVVKWIGVCYLFWLAFFLWRAIPSSSILSTPETSTIKFNNPQKAFCKSLFLALSNPKGLLFFSAFLPQFLNTSLPQFPQYAEFAISTVIIDVIIMFCYAMLGVHMSKYFSSFKLLIVNRTCAIILACMASGLAFYKKTS